jgi:hypothetical protein
MTLTGLPPEATTVGSIEILLYLDNDGIGTAYGFEGVAPEAALGYMTIVMDRIREERSFQWDTCPGCGEPMASHGDQDEEDDDYYELPDDDVEEE